MSKHRVKKYWWIEDQEDRESMMIVDINEIIDDHVPTSQIEEFEYLIN